jgi:hypothetical protein
MKGKPRGPENVEGACRLAGSVASGTAMGWGDVVSSASHPPVNSRDA